MPLPGVCFSFVQEKGGGGVTPRQEKFCVEYLIDLNATQAAIRAGYSPNRADSTAYNLLRNTEIKNKILEIREKEFEETIATAKEAEAFLARAMRGEIKEEVIVTEGTGDGCSDARIMRKQICAKDRIKAAELIGKRNNLFSPDTQVNVTPVIITGSDDVYD